MIMIFIIGAVAVDIAAVGVILTWVRDYLKRKHAMLERIRRLNNDTQCKIYEELSVLNDNIDLLVEHIDGVKSLDMPE